MTKNKIYPKEGKLKLKFQNEINENLYFFVENHGACATCLDIFFMFLLTMSCLPFA